MKAEFDLECRYESFVDNGKKELKRIFRLVEIECDEDKLNEIVQAHSRENILSESSKDKANLFTGARNPIPKPLENMAKEELVPTN